MRDSSVSGGDVYLSYHEYPEKGKFVSYGELDKLPAYKVDIDDVKDIDSLVRAVKENFYYCGNKNLGKSVEVEASDGCFDSGFVLESNDVYKSQYIAYSAQLLDSKFVFGSSYAAKTVSVIRMFHSLASTRIFQTGYICESSDLYLSWYMIGCQECILSFNQRGKKHLVGNVELPKEKYFSHNCENVHEVMFCSNVKNLRYAVGNVVVEKEKYLEIKEIVLKYILGELEKKKSMDLNIFNIEAL